MFVDPAGIEREVDALGLTGDEHAVYVEVLTAFRAEREISDACARVIATWWLPGRDTPGYAFVSTGEILEENPGDLWYDLGGHGYRDAETPLWVQVTLDLFGTYLTSRRDARGPVPGWSKLWIR